MEVGTVVVGVLGIVLGSVLGFGLPLERPVLQVADVKFVFDFNRFVAGFSRSDSAIAQLVSL